MNRAGNFKDVQRELAYAYEHTRFFRDHMDLNGFKPENIKTIEDFKNIPVTRKLHYRKNYPKGVLAEGFSLSDTHVMRFQSSGTSEERLNSSILTYDLARRQATSMAVNKNFDSIWRPGGRPKICRYAPPNCSDVECALGISMMEDRILKDGTLVLSVAHDLLATPEKMIHQALDEIEMYDPELLVVDPTHLAFLIRNAKRLKRNIKTSQKLHIVCGYTHLTNIARRQIRDFFGREVPIGNMLGMSELGYLGFECHHGNLHMNNKDFFLEFIDRNGDVALGTPGELVISTIEDELIPKIRYATGDIYCLLESSCSCGSDLPLVTIEGRSTHNLRLHTGTIISPNQVDSVVGECPGIDLYKIEQQDNDFLFRYIRNEGLTEKQRSNLEVQISELLFSCPVRFEEVSYIACERSGKFQSCTSKVTGV